MNKLLTMEMFVFVYSGGFMKKILVDVNEAYLEQCRSMLEKRWGVSVSNSQLVSHLLFLHHDTDYEIFEGFRRKIVEAESKKIDKKFESTAPGEPRTPLRSLMQAYEESKK